MDNTAAGSTHHATPAEENTAAANTAQTAAATAGQTVAGTARSTATSDRALHTPRLSGVCIMI